MTKRLLLIDDDSGARRIIQLSLEAAAGWQVLTAASGPAGMAIAVAELPDAILLDVMMPELDGPATYQKLQAHPKTQTIPVIMLTAKAGPGEQQSLLDLGISGIITKPFKVPALIAEIRRLLNWSIEI
ncbi:MAG: response regulator [Cyanobacteria bacterium P01_C01_bin.120]